MMAEVVHCPDSTLFRSLKCLGQRPIFWGYLSNEKAPWLFRVYRGLYDPNHIGIVINHLRIPIKTTSIMEGRRVFSLWLTWYLPQNMILLPCCTAWNRIKTWRAHLAVSFYSVPCATHAWIWMQKKQWTNWPRLSSAAKVLQSVHLCTGVLHTLSQKGSSKCTTPQKKIDMWNEQALFIHVYTYCACLSTATK